MQCNAMAMQLSLPISIPYQDSIHMLILLMVTGYTWRGAVSRQVLQCSHCEGLQATERCSSHCRLQCHGGQWFSWLSRRGCNNNRHRNNSTTILTTTTQHFPAAGHRWCLMNVRTSGCVGAAAGAGWHSGGARVSSRAGDGPSRYLKLYNHI